MRFHKVVTSEAELRELYHTPSALVLNKVRTTLDPASVRFIKRSPFVLAATGGVDGMDVSPRGGAPGFVKVLDDRHLALPDLPGNNLLDTITNVVRTGRIGLLVLVPGHDETLRINGNAWLATDDDILDLFIAETRRPKAVIGIEVEQVFVHCAKAFRRSNLWQPETWAALADAPDATELLLCQGVVEGISEADLRQGFAAGYERELADELPLTTPGS